LERPAEDAALVRMPAPMAWPPGMNMRPAPTAMTPTMARVPHGGRPSCDSPASPPAPSTPAPSPSAAHSAPSQAATPSEEPSSSARRPVHYGINLRGSGQQIQAVYNPDLVSAGMSRAATPNVIEIGALAMARPEELVRTLAHELNHARSFLAGGVAPETTAYAAEDSLSAWLAGQR
jgi:hypothetical protein